jgi:hypothetical protein
MPRLQAYLKWLSEQPPLPPAPAAAITPENVIVLAERFAASYNAPRRIGMLKDAS